MYISLQSIQIKRWNGGDVNAGNTPTAYSDSSWQRCYGQRRRL